MGPRPRQFQQLEPRNLMAADADVILDMWPGPMHSTPYILGNMDDGRLVFEAETPDGWQRFKTDGTAEGTLPLAEGEWTRPSDPSPPGPPTQTLTPLNEYELLVEHSYDDGEGHAYYHQLVHHCQEPLRNGQCFYEPPPQMINLTLVGDDVLVALIGHIPFENKSDAFLANGSQDMWSQLDDVNAAHILDDADRIIIDDTLFIKTYDDRLLVPQVISRYDGAFRVGYVETTRSDHAIYVRQEHEIGRMTVDGYQTLLDLAAFEFPTTAVDLHRATDEFVYVTLNDPVYGNRSFYVSPDAAYPETDPEPWLANTPEPFGPYQLYPGAPGLFDGDQYIDVALPENAVWFDTGLGHDAIAFVEYVDFDHGTELVVRHLKPGDANLDGFFDSSDLVDILALGEYEDDLVGNSHWLTGDFNGDEEFDSSDLIAALAEGWYAA